MVQDVSSPTPMEIEENPTSEEDHNENTTAASDRWYHVKKVLQNKGFRNNDDSEEDNSEALFDFVQNTVKVLVVGAGGLGCELLKDIALMGFRQIDVIDMDTIDVSNLNRQFLFREKDVGRFKAEVAAEFINKRIEGVVVTPHNCKIQEKDEDFYRQFTIVVCGLDSIVARRWINGMLHSLLQYDNDGELNQATIIPLIDGGTEGFKGNARVIYPGMSPCIDCSLSLFPKQVNFPLCTIASTPRLPEHCVEYVRILQWDKETPFQTKEGDPVPIDGDDPEHINWIYQKALERGAQFSITGITYRFTQGVIKHIIPAVASTNAVIAASLSLEAFKVITSCANPLQNYMVFNQTDGIYTYAYEAEREENCYACCRSTQTITLNAGSKLQALIDMLMSDQRYQMKAPGLRMVIQDTNTQEEKEARHKTLYFSNPEPIEKATRPNLEKTLEELGLANNPIVIITDSTTPRPIEFKITIA